MDAARIALEIEDELRGAGDPARAEHEKAYLRSDLRHFGASVPAIRKITKGAFEDHVPGRGELLLLVETLPLPQRPRRFRGQAGGRRSASARQEHRGGQKRDDG